MTWQTPVELLTFIVNNQINAYNPALIIRFLNILSMDTSIYADTIMLPSITQIFFGKDVDNIMYLYKKYYPNVIDKNI